MQKQPSMRDRIMHKKYGEEPIWQKMEQAMKLLKQFYATNPWVFQDQESMMVLEQERKSYEEAEAKIEETVEEQKRVAHNELEEKFSRMHDKKILQLQIKAMHRELRTLNKMRKIKYGQKEK